MKNDYCTVYESKFWGLGCFVWTRTSWADLGLVKFVKEGFRLLQSSKLVFIRAHGSTVSGLVLGLRVMLEGHVYTARLLLASLCAYNPTKID